MLPTTPFQLPCVWSLTLCEFSPTSTAMRLSTRRVRPASRATSRITKPESVRPKVQSPNLDPERATECPGAIVRLRSVVTHEDAAVAAITIERATEFSNISRCFHPARRLRIEIPEFLQLQILFFHQKLNAHGRSHIHSGVFRSMFLSRFQPFPVVTNTGAAFRTFR